MGRGLYPSIRVLNVNPIRHTYSFADLASCLRDQNLTGTKCLPSLIAITSDAQIMHVQDPSMMDVLKL